VKEDAANACCALRENIVANPAPHSAGENFTRLRIQQGVIENLK
jgi:hypothetical protein